MLIALAACVSAGPIAAAPENEPVIWQVHQPDQVGGAKPEVLGAPKPRAGATPSVSFNGRDDGLLVPANPLAGHARFTIEMLIFPESGGGEEQRFFHAEDTDKSRGLLELRVLPGNRWCLDAFLKAGDMQKVLLDREKGHPLDRWHWVAMSYDGKTLVSYVNGVRELGGDLVFPAMKDGKISLGVRQNQISWFKGAIREVRFHADALAPDRLQTALPEK